MAFIMYKTVLRLSSFLSTTNNTKLMIDSTDSAPINNS